MRWDVLAVAVLAVIPMTALAPGLAQDADAQTQPRTGQRAFALVMEGNNFNGQTWPDTPLLEAYEGEEMQFVVHTALAGGMHTFHMHGHPWEAQDEARLGFIDAIRLDGGETHDFTATAGLGEGHAGDWFYHCHVTTHFAEGMWGLLRVYPYSMHVAGPLDGLEITLIDDGEGLEDATFTAKLRSGSDQVTAATAGEGDPVDVNVQELGDGRYRVEAGLSPTASGELVLTSHHEEGESVARLDLTAGGYELDRDVGPSSSAADDIAVPTGANVPLG